MARVSDAQQTAVPHDRLVNSVIKQPPSAEVSKVWARTFAVVYDPLPPVVHSADARIHIPLERQVESLNAAAAAAVLFYEAFRQRQPQRQ